MICKSSAVLFVVALCAFQGTQANMIDDIISSVTAAANQTMNAIKEKITEFENSAESMMESVQEKIQEAEQQASQAVEQWVEKAKEVGANITECVQAAQPTVDNAANATESAVSACWQTAKQSLESDEEEMKNDMSKVTSFGQAAAKNMSSCGMNMICWSKVISNAASQGASITQEIMSDASSMGSDLASAGSTFMSCAQEAVSSGVSSVQSAYQQEAQCIQEKIQAVSQ